MQNSAKFENKILGPLKETARRKRFCTFDIEAQNWNQFLMAGFYDGKEYIYCPTLETLVNTCLKNKYSGAIIYSHYGGGYDMRFILDYVLKNKPALKVEIIETHGLIMALDIYSANRKRHWRFYDSWQVVKGSLEELSKVFNIEHKKLTGTVDRANLTDTPETRAYLENDVIGLYEIIDQFYKIPLVEGVGHKMTTSSLAMSVFRQKYLGETVLYKLTEDKEDFVRAGYYGGRNEIFKMEAENVFEYDVNSMYVAAMLNPLPCGSEGTWAAGYDFDCPDTVAYIYADVFCPEHIHIPLLPIKYRGKLIFPKGRFSGVFFSAELQKAIQLGYQVQINQALIFPCACYLADYARDCWNIRQENPGKNPLNMTAKLLGNGLYGKFAQDRNRENITQEKDFEKAAAAGWSLIMPEYNLWRYPTYSDSPAILPYISAAITAYSRLTLYSFLEIDPVRMVYTDTDSVFIEGRELPSGKGLGELKFENHHKRFIAIQPKFYYCEPDGKPPKLKAKGFTFNETMPWGYDDFKYALDYSDYSGFYQMGDLKFSKLREAIKNLDLLMLVQRKRSVKSEYSKRIINPDYSTSPLDMQELTAAWDEQERLKWEREQQRIFKREAANSRREFRRMILDLGGIKNSPDYEAIPRWCRRINGLDIDIMADQLKYYGYPCDDANMLYELLYNV